MSDMAQMLRRAIAEEEPRLRAISDPSAGISPDVPGKWSRKQELGHLIDSATNNRVRIAKAATEGQYAGPSYDPVAWVELGGYAGMSWSVLIDLWKMLNEALGVALDRVPPRRLEAECRIGDAQPATLRFVIEDYILHMQHHLDHILGRERMTEYPSAAARK